MNEFNTYIHSFIHSFIHSIHSFNHSFIQSFIHSFDALHDFFLINRLPVNTRSLIYKWGMWSSGAPEDWNQMWKKYKTEVVPQEKVNFLRALAMIRTPWLVSK